MAARRGLGKSLAALFDSMPAQPRTPRQVRSALSEVDVQRHLDVLTDEVHALRVRVEELLRERGVTDDTTFPGLLRAAANSAACASGSLRGAALFPLALARATGERVVKCVQTRLPMPGQRAPAADPTWLDSGD